MKDNAVGDSPIKVKIIFKNEDEDVLFSSTNHKTLSNEITVPGNRTGISCFPADLAPGVEIIVEGEKFTVLNSFFQLLDVESNNREYAFNAQLIFTLRRH